MADFFSELQYEENFYITVLKPFLEKQNCSSIFLRTNGGGIFDMLQRKFDVDIVTDNGKKNSTISLKVRRQYYPDIFFETVSNCEKGTLGWGMYSLADFVCYAMPKDSSWIIVFFKTENIRSLEVEKYPIRYGSTYINNNLVYRTKGRIIPLIDFKNRIIHI